MSDDLTSVLFRQQNENQKQAWADERQRRLRDDAARRAALPPPESFAEFRERHGGEYVFIGNGLRTDSGRILFGDGAQSETSGIARMEPPADPAHLLQLRAQFLQLKLERDEASFVKMKAALKEQIRFFQTNVGPMPPAEAIKHLRKMPAMIEATRAELVALAAPDANPATRRLEVQHELQQRNLQIASEALAQLGQIEI